MITAPVMKGLISSLKHAGVVTSVKERKRMEVWALVW